MLYKVAKINKTKTVVDPTNRNDHVYYFNNINNFDNNRRNAIIGGATDISGTPVYIKTRDKNVSGSIPFHNTYVSSIGIIEASNELSTYEAYNVCAGKMKVWRTNVIENSTWSYTFLSNNIVTEYMIVGDVLQGDASPSAWELTAWNNSTENWDLLDTQTNQALSSGIEYHYSFTNSTAYNKYKFTFFDNCGHESFLGVSVIQLFLGDTSILPNQIVVEASTENPLYFYRYLGTDENSVEQSAIYTFTENVSFTNTFNNAFTILYAIFDDLKNNFIIKYDSYTNINNMYTLEQQQNNLIPLATFQTSVDGYVGIPYYTTYIRNPDDVYFLSHPQLKTDRTYYTATTCNDKIYLMGGSVNLAWNEAYNLNTNSWESKTNIAVGRHYSTSQAIDDYVFYITGGSATTTALLWNSEYDTIGDAWLNKTNIPVGVRQSASTLVDNNLIYICGGTTASATYLMWHREWNKTNDVWTAKTNLPSIRGKHTYSNVDNNLYAIGHQTLSTTVINDMYSYADNTWTSKTNRPRTGIGPSANVYDDKIYVSGVTNITDVYDPSVDSWTTLENNLLANKVIGTEIILHNNILYQFDSTDTYSYPLYDNANFLSMCSTKTVIPLATVYTSSAVHGKDIYVMRGSNDVNNLQYNTIADAWSFKLPFVSVTSYSGGGSNVPQINSTIFILSAVNILALYSIYTNNYIYKYIQANSGSITISYNLKNEIYICLPTTYTQYNIETDTEINKNWNSLINTVYATTESNCIKNDIYYMASHTDYFLNYSYLTYTDVWVLKTPLIYSVPGIYRRAPSSSYQNKIIYNENSNARMYSYDSITDTHSTEHRNGVKSNPSTAIVGNSFYLLSGNNTRTDLIPLK